MLLYAFLIPYGFNCVFGANILLAYVLPSPSHQLWDYSLAEGLMAKGHNITMLGAFADKGNVGSNYHPLVVEGMLDVIAKNPNFDFERGITKINTLTYLTVLKEFALTICNHSYHSDAFAALMNYPKGFEFDLIIIDVTRGGSCFLPLIQIFGYPPAIGITAMFLQPDISREFGNVVQPSYLPLLFSEFTENMGFFQRVFNYILTYMNIAMKPLERRQIEAMAKGVFGGNLESMERLQRHISLLLCNLNPAVIYPQPLTPNIIPVGGLHIKEASALPTDLQTIMDKSIDGVILFALGTNVRSDNLNSVARQKLLKAFAGLKQTIIWKFESELDNLPKNVVIRKWLPQNDILAHPKTKLFISHGGALSTYEAIYHGVPIIGMPFFLDQRVNVNSMVEKKLALKIDIHDFTSNELLENINELLNNPEYSNNLKDYSSRMRDQPQSPLDRAVFWAEYAMRHNGAHFMNSKSRDMSYFVSSSLDVILFLVSVTVFFICAIFLMLFRYIRLCFKPRPVIKEKLR